MCGGQEGEDDWGYWVGWGLGAITKQITGTFVISNQNGAHGLNGATFTRTILVVVAFNGKPDSATKKMKKGVLDQPESSG